MTEKKNLDREKDISGVYEAQVSSVVESKPQEAAISTVKDEFGDVVKVDYDIPDAGSINES